jgi:hypothetical protein
MRAITYGDVTCCLGKHDQQVGAEVPAGRPEVCKAQTVLVYHRQYMVVPSEYSNLAVRLSQCRLTEVACCAGCATSLVNLRESHATA